MKRNMIATTAIGTSAAIALATATTHAAVLVDTISPGTWQNHPGWIVPTSYDEGAVGGIGIRVVGNGQILNRIGLVVSLWDGDTQVTGVGANDARMRFGLFSSQQAFLSANWTFSGNPLPTAIGFSNPTWNVPIGTYGGVHYYYVEVDLHGLGLTLQSGQEYILGAAYQNLNLGLPHAGFAQGALGGPFGGDLYALTGFYLGSSAGFIAQFGNPPAAGVTNVAAFVSTVAPPNPYDLDGDGKVNAADLAILLGGWGGAAHDLTSDGIVDAADLGALLGAWTG